MHLALIASVPPRSLGGVAAAFEIIDHVVPVGEDMRIRVVYRNTGDQPVTFRYLQSDQFAQVCAIGKKPRKSTSLLLGKPLFQKLRWARASVGYLNKAYF
jgi:hypothetical protein